MRRGLFLLLLCGFWGCQNDEMTFYPDTVEVKTTQDTISYSLGLDMGRSSLDQAIKLEPEVFMRGVVDGMTEQNASYLQGGGIGDGFRRRGIEIKANVFLRGLLDGIEKNTTLLEDEEVVRALQVLQKKLMAGIREAERIQMAEQNLKLAQAWLEDNKEKEGVVVLGSGLQYKILEASTGPKPTSERDTVKVNYRGKLINGEEFDSSYRRGTPSRFALNRVIPGWTEGLQLMPTASIWELYIPPHLGYGDQTSGAIEPNSVLIFEVKLLEVTLENPAGN